LSADPPAAAAREPLVLMVGRLDAAEAYKGHAEMIAAWPAILARVPAARLVIVGDGDDLPRVRRLARSAGVSRAVDFPGFVSRDALLDLYRRASVFALPSRGEGFGLVYLEAMAHRLPCLGSRDDAASDVIVDGATGFLVAPEDRALVAHRLAMLLQNPALRDEMGRAGERRLRERFTYAGFSTRLLGFVDEHLERSA
jgi:phosphatidylinositol alpha-1,6-mannosyltransferase